MSTQALMRIATQALSLLLGSSGVFCLWASFYVPHFALQALLLLSTATAVTLVPEQTK